MIGVGWGRSCLSELRANQSLGTKNPNTITAAEMQMLKISFTNRNAKAQLEVNRTIGAF